MRALKGCAAEMRLSATAVFIRRQVLYTRGAVVKPGGGLREVIFFVPPILRRRHEARGSRLLFRIVHGPFVPCRLQCSERKI